ncbi:MAG: SpoIIE family protein phosphatase [Microcoleus sp.]
MFNFLLKPIGVNQISSNIARPSPNVGLRTTLILPFVLQIFAAVGLVSYLSFRSGQQSVNNLVTNLQNSVAQRVEENIHSYLESLQFLNRINAAKINSGDLNPDDFEQLKPYFLNQLKIQNKTDYFIYANALGDSLGIVRTSPDTFELKMRDRYSVPNRVTYELTPDGQLGKELESEPFDPRKRPFYKAAVAAGKPTWSQIFISFSRKILRMDAITPIYAENGEFRGVFSTEVTLAQISNFLKTLKISPKGEVFILERSGEIVASSTDELPFVKTADGEQRLLALQSQKPIIRKTTEQILTKFQTLDRIAAPENFTFNLNDEPQLVHIQPYQDRWGLNWLVAIVVPESDFMEQINANTRNNVLLSLAALGVALILGIITTRTISNPILRLTQASKELADGNFDRRVDTKDFVEVEEIETLEQCFNSMAVQLQEAFETLEDKVKDRTAELACANAEIYALNERLKSDNLCMSSQLDLIEQMQQLILPKLEELQAIKNLDIAGFMEPAERVGGDYYDVLEADGVVTIGIGDVTGHGLESGILMVMIQASVRTLQEIKETDPVRFLDTLNRTIYKNVQRMNCDKNLTLAILNYDRGRISISGQHEETLIVRKGGKIERIDTINLGFPIGLDDDIAHLIGQKTVELVPGDGVVLYTDGIPEARNIDRQFYGLERLCEVVALNWHKTAEEIKQAAIDDLRGFIGEQQVFDDITLVVLKRADEEIA